MAPCLSSKQLERYKRNILLDEVGEEGQRRLLQSRVLVIGLGGLGSPAALYLAAAGVGTLGLADFDRVDLSNLQRQILHAGADLGRRKTASARERLTRLNPDIETVCFDAPVDADSIDACLRGFDFVIDATDTLAAKFLINDGCLRTGIPFSHGGISKFYGQTMTVLPGRSACCRCLFGEHGGTAEDESAGEGLFGAVAGIVGSMQAAEALKYLTGAGELLVDALLCLDIGSMKIRTIPVSRQNHCQAPGCSR